MMRALFVGVSDAKLTREADASLVTYALASCVGIAIYDPVSGVGGLLHYLLPDSRLDPVKAQEHPWMFADTAIPMLFQQAYRLGAEKSRLRVVVAGGAQILQADNSLEIGKRNQLAMRRIFWKSGVLLAAEDVGGSDIRTLRLEVGTGRLMIRRNGMPEQVLYSPRDMTKIRGGRHGI
jgi:chemotaxis protein CheD